MVPFDVKVLAKFGFCSNCSQKLDAPPHKIFGTAQILVKNLCSVAEAYNLHLGNSWKTLGK